MTASPPSPRVPPTHRLREQVLLLKIPIYMRATKKQQTTFGGEVFSHNNKKVTLEKSKIKLLPPNRTSQNQPPPHNCRFSGQKSIIFHPRNCHKNVRVARGAQRCFVSLSRTPATRQKAGKEGRKKFQEGRLLTHAIKRLIIRRSARMRSA